MKNDSHQYQRFLSPDEELVGVFKIGDRYMWLSMVFGFPFAILLIGLPHLLKVLHLRHSKTYLLTNRRILIKNGIFNVELVSAPLDKITHTTVRQDFLPRLLFGIGDIVIHTAGPTPVEIILEKVHEPIKVKNLIEGLITAEKRWSGKIQEENPLIKPL